MIFSTRKSQYSSKTYTWSFTCFLLCFGKHSLQRNSCKHLLFLREVFKQLFELGVVSFHHSKLSNSKVSTHIAHKLINNFITLAGYINKYMIDEWRHTQEMYH